MSGYGVADLVDRIQQGSETEVSKLIDDYREDYSIAKEHDRPEALRAAARIELGLRGFLTEGGFGAFTYIPFKICTDSTNCPASQFSDLWQMDSVSLQKEIGRQPRCYGP